MNKAELIEKNGKINRLAKKRRRKRAQIIS
ncbi:MAG: hypothetical protein L6V90_07080 [Treponema succinifaciens]|nr:MAG: hypothetical protein L6V90_07080 [Treponema succinifaciens]